MHVYYLKHWQSLAMSFSVACNIIKEVNHMCPPNACRLGSKPLLRGRPCIHQNMSRLCSVFASYTVLYCKYEARSLDLDDRTDGGFNSG